MAKLKNIYINNREIIKTDNNNILYFGSGNARDGLFTNIAGNSIFFNTGTGQTTSFYVDYNSNAALYGYLNMQKGKCIAFTNNGSDWHSAIGTDNDYNFVIGSDLNTYLDFTNLHIRASGSTEVGTITKTQTSFSIPFYINSNVYVTGSTHSTLGFYQDSDERLKNVGENIDVDLEKLSKLRKFYYEFKNNEGEKKIGVSAQEIKEIYPELVYKNEEGYLSVNYGELSVVALAAIDKQEEKINKQQEEIDNLKKQIEEIKSMLNK